MLSVVVDESGDLGWKFDLPFRAGGSSRFLTIACVVLPDICSRQPYRLMRKLRKKYGWEAEKKAADASQAQRVFFCQKVADMVRRHPTMKIDTITVNKANVAAHIREDPNKLYNWMLALVVPDHVKHENDFRLVVDERSIKVRSQNSLADYLQTKLWFEFGVPTRLHYEPMMSQNSYAVQFADWIANCVWRSFEDSDGSCEAILWSVVGIRRLFFEP